MMLRTANKKQKCWKIKISPLLNVLIRCIFFKLINVKMPMIVKMPKIVDILIFMSRINFMLNLVEQ